jgi:hypothetical protein
MERGECIDAFCDGGSWGWCGEEIVMAWGWAAVLLKGLLKGTCSQRSGVESSYVELMHVLLHLGLGKDREDKGA